MLNMKRWKAYTFSISKHTKMDINNYRRTLIHSNVAKIFINIIIKVNNIFCVENIINFINTLNFILF